MQFGAFGAEIRDDLYHGKINTTVGEHFGVGINGYASVGETYMDDTFTVSGSIGSIYGSVGYNTADHYWTGSAGINLIGTPSTYPVGYNVGYGWSFGPGGTSSGLTQNVTVNASGLASQFRRDNPGYAAWMRGEFGVNTTALRNAPLGGPLLMFNPLGWTGLSSDPVLSTPYLSSPLIGGLGYNNAVADAAYAARQRLLRTRYSVDPRALTWDDMDTQTVPWTDGMYLGYRPGDPMPYAGNAFSMDSIGKVPAAFNGHMQFQPVAGTGTSGPDPIVGQPVRISGLWDAENQLQQRDEILAYASAVYASVMRRQIDQRMAEEQMRQYMQNADAERRALYQAAWQAPASFEPAPQLTGWQIEANRLADKALWAQIISGGVETEQIQSLKWQANLIQSNRGSLWGMSTDIGHQVVPDIAAAYLGTRSGGTSTWAADQELFAMECTRALVWQSEADAGWYFGKTGMRLPETASSDLTGADFQWRVPSIEGPQSVPSWQTSQTTYTSLPGSFPSSSSFGYSVADWPNLDPVTKKPMWMPLADSLRLTGGIPDNAVFQPADWAVATGGFHVPTVSSGDLYVRFYTSPQRGGHFGLATEASFADMGLPSRYLSDNRVALMQTYAPTQLFWSDVAPAQQAQGGGDQYLQTGTFNLTLQPTIPSGPHSGSAYGFGSITYQGYTFGGGPGGLSLDDFGASQTATWWPIR